MKHIFYLLFAGIILIYSCKKEHDHNHDTTDTSTPVVTLNSPAESSVYNNGDTVFITGSVTDNELHSGIIIIKDDTTLTEYYNQYHSVHDMTAASISYFYVVNGITQNRAATLTLTYEDHVPNTSVVTRQLIFMP